LAPNWKDVTNFSKSAFYLTLLGNFSWSAGESCDK